MELKNFSIDKINQYTIWYMLNKIKNGPISIVRRTPAGDEQFTDFECFKMNDGNVLIGFNHFMSIVSKYNFVAISGDIEEIVNIQMFENIMDYYDVPVNNTDKGYFVFVDSISITPQEEWRCDNTMYGPMSYGIAENVHEKIVFSLDQIIAYEPIFSVNGTSHLVYMHFKDTPEMRYEFANKLQLPICGSTISEAFKLITEWATVASEPFNNQQFISQDAKDFLSKLDFDTSLVDYQVDMHIAEFLKSNPDARKRPDNVQPLSNELNMFIKKHMAYRCLSAIICLYPDAWNLQEVIDAEEKAFIKLHDLFTYNPDLLEKPLVVKIFNNIVDRTIQLHKVVKTTGIF